MKSMITIKGMQRLLQQEKQLRDVVIQYYTDETVMWSELGPEEIDLTLLFQLTVSQLTTYLNTLCKNVYAVSLPTKLYCNYTCKCLFY